MAAISRKSLRNAVVALLVGAWATAGANADALTFSTTGVFSVSGTNVVSFTNIDGTTTITFNGTTDPINTPVGASFGDIVVSSTVPPNLLGPAIGGTFTLNFFQVSPAGSGSLVGTLAGTLGFSTGIATITFGTNTVAIGTITYTVDPTYALALPVTGNGGGAVTGTITLQGAVEGTVPTTTPTATVTASPTATTTATATATPTPTPTPPIAAIPAVSERGVIALVLLLGGLGYLIVRRASRG